MHKITLFFLLCAGVNLSLAQDVLVLSLQDAIGMAQAQSPDAQAAELELKASGFDYKAFQASLKPQLSLNADLPGLRRSISDIIQDDGSIKFLTQSQTFSRMSLQVQQPLTFSGGQIFAFSSLANVRNFEPFDSERWQSSPLVMGLRQPLFRLNPFKWNQKEQSIRYKLAQVNYARQLEAASQEISGIYFQALTAQANRDRARINVANNDTIFELSQGRFSVGKIAENELLQSELSLMNARANLEQASVNLERALRQLKTALGLDRQLKVEILTPDQIPTLNVDPDVAVSQALTYSQLVHQQELTELQADRFIAITRQDNRFNATLNATFGLNQTAEGFGDAYNNLLDAQTFSVGLDIPLFNWGRNRAEVKAAELRYESIRLANRQDRQQFADDVYYQAINLSQLRSQVEIADRSVDVGQRRYDIAKNRYLIGKIDIRELVNAQQDKDRAQEQYYQSLENFWTSYIRLRETTLYDFEAGKPLIEENDG